jgi:hypothetical protein
MEKQNIELSGIVKHYTNMAVLVDFGHEKTWIPRSQIVNIDEIDIEDDNVAQEFELPEWLAIEKDLI